MISTGEFARLRGATRERLEETIDNALRHAAERGVSHVTIARGKCSSDDVEAVLALYRSYGWKARLITDPRDGDYIHLEMP